MVAVNYRPLGAAVLVSSSAMLVDASGYLDGTVYGATDGRVDLAGFARDGADHGTLWADDVGPVGIFVTHNADTAEPSDSPLAQDRQRQVTEALPERRSTSTPGANQPGHAWETYSGYNAVTPSTRGHVFEVRENGVRGLGPRFWRLHEPERRGGRGGISDADEQRDCR